MPVKGKKTKQKQKQKQSQKVVVNINTGRATARRRASARRSGGGGGSGGAFSCAIYSQYIETHQVICDTNTIPTFTSNNDANEYSTTTITTSIYLSHTNNITDNNRRCKTIRRFSKRGSIASSMTPVSIDTGPPKPKFKPPTKIDVGGGKMEEVIQNQPLLVVIHLRLQH